MGTVFGSCVGLACAAAFAAQVHATVITYQVSNVGGATWEYAYTVSNDTLGVDLENFVVRFDAALFENLVAGPAPAGWDPLAFQPDPLLPSDGVYDALALVAGIAPGATLGVFRVQFDFLGAGTPGAQPFEVFDPFFAVLDSGTTMPDPAVAVGEPGAFALLLAPLATMGFAGRRPRREGGTAME